MDKKFNFKLDKDKIKLQLKDLGKKFAKKKGRFRNAFLIFMFFVLLGVGFVIYNDQQADPNNISNNQVTEENVKLDYGEEQPSFYSAQESESDFTLNYPGIRENENTEDKQSTIDKQSQSIRQNEDTGEDIEGVVTESVRPINQIQQDGWDLELLRPVAGEIIQDSGWYYHSVLDDWRYQNGLEFSGNAGEVVMAAAKGQVSTVHEDNYKGIVVLVEHENGWVTEYGHLQRAAVSPGERISKGQEIGSIGVTGMTSQPSLYFSLKNEDGAIDPVAYFQ